MLLNKWVLAGGAAIVVGGVAAVSAATLSQSKHSAERDGAPAPTTIAAAPATPRPHVAGPQAADPNGAQPGGATAGGDQPGPVQPIADKPFATKTVTVQGVTFEVPTTWGVAPVQTGATDCLTIGGLPVKSVDAASTCQLAIRVVSAQGAAEGGFEPDKPYVVGDGNMCGSAGALPRTVKTVQASDATVGGYAAEFRAFTGGCFKGTWEQWTVPTAPGVILTRSYADPATEQAARYVVAHAQLPGARSALPLTDRGIIRSVTNTADGVHITLDRVTRLEQGGIQNVNPATYPYILPANLKINSPMANQGSLTVAQLLQLAAGHTVNGVTPPLSTLGAYLHTNGTTVTSMDLFVI
jgi:hypothetical protein